MRIFTDWRNVPPDARGATVALGKFDGVHLGHASVIRAAHAARPDAPLAVLTFEPHPREVFRADDPPFRLTLSAERADALAGLGVHLLYELPFNHDFSLMTAEEFVVSVLHDGLGASHLVAGQDFAFGHRRGGSTDFLADRAESLGMGLTLVPLVTDSQGPLSSTRIRLALQDGYPERATAELGRPWAIRGLVSHGDKRGRTIGFPTANVPLGRHLEPARGVYAVTIRLADGTNHKGVANIGRRPTVNAGPESRLEVNLFNFDGDLYGTDITVALHAYIRPETRFSGIDALKAQIARDAAEAKDTAGLILHLSAVAGSLPAKHQEDAMPVLKRPDGEIHYKTYGKGFPVLLFAPGGLRSRMEMWPTPPGGPPRPWVDWTQALPQAGFTAVAMDQRNAGASRTAIEAKHGWHTYAADHIALMDHLGFDRFHVLGGCIGGSFCLKAVETAPKRVASAVLQNPIGLHPEYPEYFPDSHVEWTNEQLAARPGLSADAIAGFGRNMWDHPFVFCVDSTFVRNCPVPTFLLPGTDIPHPAATSAELAALLPGVEVLTEWRGPEFLEQQRSRVVAFLKRHTPAQ